MAKRQRAEQVEQSGGQKAAGETQQGGVLAWAGIVVAATYQGLTRDGAVDAFLRQGANELGAVLGKALPDSVQIDEPGAPFNPLYRDMPSPTGPDVYGRKAEARTPSEIADDKTPGQQQQQEREQDLEL